MSVSKCIRAWGRILGLSAASVLLATCGDGDQPQSSPAPAPFSPTFFVSPSGTPQGSGGEENPWDLDSVLQGLHDVPPGSTIFLKEGVHKKEGAALTGTDLPPFVSQVTGGPGAPITFRSVPGQRARVEGGIQIWGSHTRWEGIEIYNPATDRTQVRPAGMTVRASHTQLINLVIHDTGDGIGFWVQAVDSEVYGCILYNNGHRNPQTDFRGHGHGMYIQNDTGTKRIRNVISCNNYATGMKAYGEQGLAKNIEFDRIISFSNGLISGPEHLPNLQVGTAVYPTDNIQITHCAFYQPKGAVAGNMSFGYLSKGNINLTVTNNYSAGGYGGIGLDGFLTAIVRNNFFYAAAADLPGKETILVNLLNHEDPSFANFDWDDNEYYDTSKVDGSGDRRTFFATGVKNIWDTSSLTYQEWRNGTGLDANSSYHGGEKPTGLKTLLFPNEHDPNRFHVAVYNWDLKDTVELDVSQVLQVGDPYTLTNVQNLFGPKLSGIYDGKLMVVPMVGWTIAKPIGYDPALENPEYATTFPEFGTFLLTKGVP